MKLYSKEEFLKLPEGTLFIYGPEFSLKNLNVSGRPLNVKYESMDCDFMYKPLVNIDADTTEVLMQINDKTKEEVSRYGISSSFPMELDCVSRDGIYDIDSTYIVFDNEEIKAIIASLQSLVK